MHGCQLCDKTNFISGKTCFFYNACKTFPVWLQNRLISDRLELVYERFKRVDLMKVESLDRYI